MASDRGGPPEPRLQTDLGRRLAVAIAIPLLALLVLELMLGRQLLLLTADPVAGFRRLAGLVADDREEAAAVSEAERRYQRWREPVQPLLTAEELPRIAP